MNVSKLENVFSLPLVERAKISIVDMRTSGLGSDTVNFSRSIEDAISRTPEDLRYPRSSLFELLPDQGVVFTNLSPSSSGVDIVSFHFPGASGQWDEDRCGSQFDGYAGAALRGGLGKSIILDWGYASNKGSKPNINNEIDDVIKAISVSNAKKVYLSGRSYGAVVVLFAVEEVKRRGIEIIGVDLKVPALSNAKYNLQLAKSLSGIPLMIVRGDHDLNTSISATNDLYKKVSGPEAIITLKDIAAKKPNQFNHHLDSPELKLASAAATEIFIKDILS